MPSRSPTAHFLGLELATDQLRAAVVDEQLDVIGVELVDFDTELSEFQYVSRISCCFAYYFPSFSSFQGVIPCHPLISIPRSNIKSMTSY